MEKSEYYDTYCRRVTHLGATPQKRAFNSGVLEFKRYMKYNSHTVYDLQTLEGKVFPGVILTNKQDTAEVTQQLLVSLDTDIKIGDIIKWDNEHWLIYKQVVSSYQPYNKFYILRCERTIKWLDLEGVLHSSYAHVVSSLESKIKDNFRTWHSLITPQPNKYLEIIMPYQYMAKTTEIIVSGEAWYLVDYDKVSVPGVIYMSFTETKINEQRDNLKEEIANYDNLREWKVNVLGEIDVAAGEFVTPVYSITKDGVVVEPTEPVKFVLSDNLSFVGEKIRVNDDATGEGIIVINYGDYCTAVQKVHIGLATQNGFIDGDDKIRLTRSANYSFNVVPVVENLEVEFFFKKDAHNKYAKIEKVSGSKCKVIANSENLIPGSDEPYITLCVDYGGKTYEKNIQIISLWQVNQYGN